MDIPAIIPTIPTVPTAVSTPEANPPQTVERNLQDTSVGPSRAAQAPQIARTHAELEFDETLNRIVGRVVDETTGETIHEVPPEQLKALYTKMREQLGPLVDGSA